MPARSAIALAGVDRACSPGVYSGPAPRRRTSWTALLPRILKDVMTDRTRLQSVAEAALARIKTWSCGLQQTPRVVDRTSRTIPTQRLASVGRSRAQSRQHVGPCGGLCGRYALDVARNQRLPLGDCLEPGNAWRHSRSFLENRLCKFKPARFACGCHMIDAAKSGNCVWASTDQLGGGTAILVSRRT